MSASPAQQQETVEAGLKALLGDEATPRWLLEVDRFLPIKSVFVLSGNIRDRQPFPVGEEQYELTGAQDLLVDFLSLHGFRYFFTINPVQGITIIVPSDADPKARCAATVKWLETIEPEASLRPHFQSLAGGRVWRAADISFPYAVEFTERLLYNRHAHCAVFFNFLMGQTEQGSTKEVPAFVRALIDSYEVKSFPNAAGKALYNTVFWLCDRENDLPAWFLLNNPRLRSVPIPTPNIKLRSLMGRSLLQSIPEFSRLDAEQQTRAVNEFCTQTDGMLLHDMEAITHFLGAQKLPPSEITEAARRYKLGVTEDQWRSIGPARFAEAEKLIRKRVKGQEAAITKSLDIIRRAMVGLAGAHVSRSSSKPKGVLFFAGPTGVGKTELAKSITQGLFGDETAYVRFDMSEFNHEHADQRLIGAPPGYIGFEAGGELTDAIRERPFSVVLFDEIEKAHPKILDKFLQILDDGQLTSGKGERVYFSDTIIVFTSNLGMQGVPPMAEYEELERTLRQGIKEYFTNPQKLNRPELLNRIGDNIVVFDFIRYSVGLEILRKMVENTLERLQENSKLSITMPGLAGDSMPLPQSVFGKLAEHCLEDLTNGGRGVGNALESALINPLSRALFERSLPAGTSASIRAIEWKGSTPTIHLDVTT